MRRILPLLISLALLPPGTGDSAAGGTQRFELADFREVDGLVRQGVSINADGGAIPAPGARARVGPAVPILWEAVARQGIVYAAGGSPAMVLELPESGPGRVLHQVETGQFTALALDGSGRLIAAHSPDGLLLHLDAAGGPREMASLPSRFIWSLRLDERGNLWIAGGDPGGVYLLEPGKDEPRLLRALGAEQARCLLPWPDGRVLVGTSGGGRILAVGLDGSVEVMAQTAAHEVVGLARNGAGFDAALVHSAAAVTALGPRPPANRPANGNPAAPGTPRKGVPTRGGNARPAVSSVIRVDASGRQQTTWESSSTLAVSLLARPGGETWVGTSPAGTIERIGGDGRTSSVIDLPARSVTALRHTADGRVLAATGGLGTVVVLDPGGPREGILLSPVHDAGAGARFGEARWVSRPARGKGIALSVRSGNTSRPDSTWGAWSSWKEGGRLTAPAAPAARYVQWRARLRAPRAGSVELSRVELSYLPANRLPVIETVDVLPPGVVVENLPRPAGRAQTSATPAGARGPATPSRPTRQTFEPGKRTVTWKATDPDGDGLSAELWSRADGEPEWVPLDSGVQDGFYVFEESALGDGGFVIRLQVSDSPANTGERSASASLATERFVIDATPPVIEDLRWQGGELTFHAMDETSAPRGAQVSLDGGAFTGLLPEDGIEDQRRETYRVALSPGTPGVHVLVVRVEDAGGNTGTGRLVFEVQE